MKWENHRTQCITLFAQHAIKNFELYFVTSAKAPWHTAEAVKACANRIFTQYCLQPTCFLLYIIHNISDDKYNSYFTTKHTAVVLLICSWSSHCMAKFVTRLELVIASLLRPPCPHNLPVLLLRRMNNKWLVYFEQ